MKFRLLSMLILSLFIATGAVAGKGGKNIAGTWEGTGEAMYVDGTTADITVGPVVITQEDKFVYGTVDLAYTVHQDAGDIEVTLPEPGKISGYIKGNVLTGVFGGCSAEAPACQGASILNGKITGKGKKITGTVVDLSDGSVSVITLQRMSQ
jgi:hypothetical protein